MKRNTPIIPLTLLSLVLMMSCSSSSKISASERDGLSYETAIIAKSISYEYDWIKKKYPGSQPQQQMLTHQKRKSYDIITILSQNGETIDIYFDITSFFGKGFWSLSLTLGKRHLPWHGFRNTNKQLNKELNFITIIKPKDRVNSPSKSTCQKQTFVYPNR